jgi:hypothetical protein
MLYVCVQHDTTKAQVYLHMLVCAHHTQHSLVCLHQGRVSQTRLVHRQLPLPSSQARVHTCLLVPGKDVHIACQAASKHDAKTVDEAQCTIGFLILSEQRTKQGGQRSTIYARHVRIALTLLDAQHFHKGFRGKQRTATKHKHR